MSVLDVLVAGVVLAALVVGGSWLWAYFTDRRAGPPPPPGESGDGG